MIGEENKLINRGKKKYFIHSGPGGENSVDLQIRKFSGSDSDSNSDLDLKMEYYSALDSDFGLI